MVEEEPVSGAQGRERREHPRVPCEWTLKLALQQGEQDGGEQAIEARVRDISRAGVCFYLERALPMMALLEVKLDLPVDHGVRQVQGRGAVVRCEPISAAVDHYEIAVFLHDMAEPDRAAIDAFVTRQGTASSH